MNFSLDFLFLLTEKDKDFVKIAIALYDILGLA